MQNCQLTSTSGLLSCSSKNRLRPLRVVRGIVEHSTRAVASTATLFTRCELDPTSGELRSVRIYLGQSVVSGWSSAAPRPPDGTLQRCRAPLSKVANSGKVACAANRRVSAQSVE